MRLRAPVFAILGGLALAAILFQLGQRQLSEAAFAFGSPPEVIEILQRALEDQKRFARLEPEREAEYRERFARIEATLHRLQILAQSRDDIVARYEVILSALLALILLGLGSGLAWRQVRRERRLEHLREALGILAAGRPVLDTGERGRGTIGRIATMIEDTSRRMAGDRQRLAMLENLSAWQEATRRHAHEMRTPITGLRLELSRLAETLARRPDAGPDEIAGHLEGAQQELDRLTEFTHRFSSFARLPKPKRVRVDLSALLAEVAEIYHEAWDNLEIRFSPGEITEVEVDRDMIRQVLVNLWDNSAAATAPDPVIVSLVVTRSPERTCVDVADDGPGIAAQVSDRLFQPYTTTRTVGEGIGLGLAISKKILLDHGGDLCLTASSPAGATFRLSLPTPPIEIPARGDSHG